MKLAGSIRCSWNFLHMKKNYLEMLFQWDKNTPFGAHIFIQNPTIKYYCILHKDLNNIFKFSNTLENGAKNGTIF